MLRDISNSVNFDAQEKNYRGSQYPISRISSEAPSDLFQVYQ